MLYKHARINTDLAWQEGQRRGLILHDQSVPVSAEIETRSASYELRAGTDESLVRLWLNGRSPHTRRAYEADIRSLLAAAGKPIPLLKLEDLQSWLASLEGLGRQAGPGRSEPPNPC